MWPDNKNIIPNINWPLSIEEAEIVFDYMNKVDATKKIQFPMEVATDTLEFWTQDLSLIKNLNHFL